MVQEFDIDLDLIAIFGFIKRTTCNPNLSPMSTFGNINITEDRKYMNIVSLKQDWDLFNHTCLIFILIINKLSKKLINIWIFLKGITQY